MPTIFLLHINIKNDFFNGILYSEAVEIRDSLFHSLSVYLFYHYTKRTEIWMFDLK